jgi:hypothetical protein
MNIRARGQKYPRNLRFIRCRGNVQRGVARVDTSLDLIEEKPVRLLTSRSRLNAGLRQTRRRAKLPGNAGCISFDDGLK